MASTTKDRILLWTGVIIGSSALLFASKLPDGYREAAQGFGWLAFLPAWLKISPCANGACSTGSCETTNKP